MSIIGLRMALSVSASVRGKRGKPGPSEIREPIVDALGRHRAEVIGILEYLDDQRGEAQTWVPPRRGALQ